ncbi:MAG: hypothetical protein GH150_04950 [Hadesarchaea archaeon]|nr:hypothetical protein [Hadesarchaea archaeon]
MRWGIGENVETIGCFVGVVRGLSEEGEKFIRCQSKCGQKIRANSGGHRETAQYLARDDSPCRQLNRPPGSAIYVLVVAHGHDDVFKVLPELMNQVRTEAPIWEK